MPYKKKKEQSFKKHPRIKSTKYNLVMYVVTVPRR